MLFRSVAGELPGGQPVVLWMTQRLLLRLLPRMFWWLESHGTPAALRVESAAPALYADAVQGFAQQAALQELVSQSPVHTQAETPQALVESVSVGQSAAHMHFVFSNAGQSLQVGMVLDAQLLRQWLSILGRQWRDAQWPMDVWPLWLQDTAFPGGYDAQGVTH